MALRAELIDDAGALERHAPAWDALAAARGRPYCTPAWMLAWWHEVAPPDALLRACVVHDGGELVGLAPFWAASEGGRHGVLGGRTASPLEPLAVAGREPEVAAAVAELLGEASPRLAELELRGLPGSSPWPRLLAQGLGCWCERTRVQPLPVIDLGERDAETWLAGLSRKLRQQLRVGRRRLDAAGAEIRVAGLDDFDRDLESLARLHHARWAHRGGSSALGPPVEAMLRRAGRELGEGRFRLLTLEAGGHAISTQLFVRGGGVLAWWLGGFDDRWARESPSLQVVVAAVRDAAEHGDRVLELGPGGQDFKYRLADHDTEVESVSLRADAG